MTQKIGVFLDRMQPVHNAHLEMVTLACKECDKVVVILGSQNKRDMLRNPFTIEMRTQLLEHSLPPGYIDKIEVYEIPDWPLVVAPIEAVWIGLFIVVIGVGIVNITRWKE